MATTSTSIPQILPAPARSLAGVSERRKILRLFVHNRMAMLGLSVVLAWVLIALLAPVIVPYDPIDQDIPHRLQAPSTAHWLGVDDLGRDVFSRLLYGGRVSLPVAVVVVIVASLFGTVYGGIS